MARVFTFILLIAAVLLPLACGDDGVIKVGFDEVNESTTPPEVQGRALLENMTEHSGISVELEEIDINLITDAEGKFSLLNELADGEWTLRASYPFFSSIEQSFTVVKGIPETELDNMELTQQIVFDVLPDKLTYTYGDTVFITLEALNVTDEPITLYSLTSPMAAFAVRYEGTTVVGGLFPGQGSQAQEVTLEPGEVQQFSLTWIIDNFDLEPGEYKIFAVLTNSGQYPDYFSPSSDLAAELNESLFQKLTPATITIGE